MEATKEINSVSHADCCIPSEISKKYINPQSDEVYVCLGNVSDEIFEMAKEVGSNGFVYGFLQSDEDVKSAFGNAEKLGITNIDFVRSGFDKIKLGDGIANRITAGCSISKASDKRAVWNEIYRILKKGGQFVVRDFYKPNGEPLRFSGNPGCSSVVFTRAEYLEMLYLTGFSMIRIVDEIKQVKNGTELTSFTVLGEKPAETASGACRI